MDYSQSMDFPRQEYWSGLPFTSPGNFRDPGIELESPALAGKFFTTESPAKPKNSIYLLAKRLQEMVWPIWKTACLFLKDPAIPTPSYLPKRSENGWTLKTSEVKETRHKATYCMIPFIWNVQKKQNYGDRLVVARDWGRKDGEWLVRIGMNFFLEWWKHSKIRLQWWLHNNTNILKTQLYTLNGRFLWYLNKALGKIRESR